MGRAGATGQRLVTPKPTKALLDGLTGCIKAPAMRKRRGWVGLIPDLRVHRVPGGQELSQTLRDVTRGRVQEERAGYAEMTRESARPLNVPARLRLTLHLAVSLAEGSEVAVRGTANSTELSLKRTG